MAIRGTSFSTSSKTTPWGITTVLSSVILEWLLIILLFIHAFFSYLITQFASYCELQVPCLLCSRLDHVMGDKDSRFYWDLICHNHKLEISSLFHNICESCLSYATRNKNQFEIYRTMVGKSSTAHCSCCNEPCIIKGHALKSVQARSITCEVPEVDMALSGVEHDLIYPKSRRVRRSTSINVSRLGNNAGSDRLSHIGYTELKITSDTESEVPISVSVSDDDSNTLVLETVNQNKHIDVECKQIEPHIVTLEDEFALEKLIDPASDHKKPSMFASMDVIEDHGGVSVSIGHGLEEHTWQQVEHKADLLLVTEDITVVDVTTSSKSTENQTNVAPHIEEFVEESKDMCKAEETIEIIRDELPEISMELSPRMFGNIDDGIKILQKRISLERNGSGFESFDGSTVSEIEGESVISRLKRQIDHDRTLMGCLYKELEEERNASAVAANEAMAMITRLQEEKATLHMEALHYLRMMEEQYMQVLQNSNDLLNLN